jgi:hypothetical protein
MVIYSYMGISQAARFIDTRHARENDCVLRPANGEWWHVAAISASDGLSGVAQDSLQAKVENSEALEPEPETADTIVRSNAFGDVDVLLRASRLGTGQGRSYSLAATVHDRHTPQRTPRTQR